MVLSKKDYQKVIHFINTTLSSSSNDFKQIQPLLSQIFGLDHSLFWRADSKGNMYNMNFHNFSDEAIADYQQVYKYKDIMNPKKQLTNVINNQETVLTLQEITTPSDFSKTLFYPYTKKHKMTDEMVMYFTNGSFIYGGIGFARFKDKKPFSFTDKSILKTLAVQLNHFLHNTISLQEMEAKKLFLEKETQDTLGIIEVHDHHISFYNEDTLQIIKSIDKNSTVESFFNTTIKPNIPSFLFEKEDLYHFYLNGWKVKVIFQETNNQTPSKKHTIYLYQQTLKTMENDSKILLSKRELEIYHLVLKGYTNEQISTQLWISIHTVKKHLRNMYDKLGVSNRTSLIYKLGE